MIKREDFISPEDERLMQEHALEAFPNEAGGVLTTKGYVRLENIHHEPTEGVRFKPGVLAKYEDAGELLAVFHSHPSSDESPAIFGPSEGDMISQASWGVPFLLAWTDGEICSHVAMWGDELERLPLLGRPFQHGISDCYEMIRDFYFITYGINLRQFPRDWMWWRTGKNLYMDGFALAGFKRISAADVQTGDVVLFKIRSDVPNHGGIVMERGLLLHHATSKNAYDPARISNTTPIGRYLEFDPLWLRYVKES